MKTCRLSPDDRYQDATDALKDLHRIGEEIGLPGRVPEAEPLNMASLFLVYKNHQQTQSHKLWQHGKPLAGGRDQYFLVAIAEFPKAASLIYQLDGRYVQSILEFDEGG